ARDGQVDDIAGRRGGLGGQELRRQRAGCTLSGLRLGDDRGIGGGGKRNARRLDGLRVVRQGGLVTVGLATTDGSRGTLGNSLFRIPLVGGGGEDLVPVVAEVAPHGLGAHVLDDAILGLQERPVSGVERRGVGGGGAGNHHGRTRIERALH